MPISTPAANTAATVTIAAVADKKIHVPVIFWSYSATPTGGNLKVESPSGTTILSVDITTGGPGYLPLDRSMADALTAGNAVVITLAAGGASVSGKLSVPSSAYV